MAATTGGPMVRVGTKWPSMTSTCSRSASAGTLAMAAPRAAKSAERREGAIRATGCTLSRRPEADDEHPVRPDGLGQQAGATAGRLPWRAPRRERVELGVAGGQPPVDTDRLVRREGADAVDEDAAGGDQRSGGGE